MLPICQIGVISHDGSLCMFMMRKDKTKFLWSVITTTCFFFYHLLSLSSWMRNSWTCSRSLPGQKINKIGVNLHLFGSVPGCSRSLPLWSKNCTIYSNLKHWAFQYKILQLLAQVRKYPLLCLPPRCTTQRERQGWKYEAYENVWTFGWVIWILFLRHRTLWLSPSKNNSPYWQVILNRNSES